MVGNWGLAILNSGDRFVLVESLGRVDPQALLVTWTAQDPKPVVLRRPAVTGGFELFGDQLLASGDFDQVVMTMTLSKLEPALSTLSPAQAVAAARAEGGHDERLLYEDLAPLPHLGAYWMEKLRDTHDPMHPLALQAMADHPNPGALPLLLAESRSTSGQGELTTAALAAQDDPQAATRLLELLRTSPANRWQTAEYESAARDQLWRTGRTAEAGLCKPHGARPLAALSQAAADQSIGTAHPFLFQDVATDGSWTVLCQARRDTDGDGVISVMLGHHGDALGDEMRPYLVVGSGAGAAFDEILANDRTGRYVAARSGACLSLVDTRRRTEAVLGNADLRNDDETFGPPRGAAFDIRGEHMLYLRGSTRGDRLVVRTLATGAEVEIDPGPGTLWHAHLDPDGRWVMADMLADRRWPHVVTTLSGRTCRGPPMSYSTFGMTFQPSFTRRWAPITGGPMRTADGFVVPFGDGALVRSESGALVTIGAKGERTELASAKCRGTVVGVDVRARRVAVVCAELGEEKWGKLFVFGAGSPVSIEPVPMPSSDLWGNVSANVIEWQGIFVDLEAGRIVPPPPGSGDIATGTWQERNGGFFARRADGAELRTVTAPSTSALHEVPDGPLRWFPARKSGDDGAARSGSR